MKEKDSKNDDTQSECNGTLVCWPIMSLYC